MSLSEGVGFINDFIAQKSDNLNQTIFGATNRASASASGQLESSASSRVTTPALDQITSNPIVNMGLDTANQAITTVSQQLLVTGAKQLEAAVNKATGIPIRKTIQDVSDGYFTVMALASTATIEIAMELARTNARTIVSLIATKEQIIAELRTEIRSLYNAMIILLNSDPFFDDYYQKLVVAYQQTKQSNSQMKSIMRTLQLRSCYNSTLYEQSLDLLVQARDAILPDRNANVTEIRGLTEILEDTITRKTNKDALAAAVSIPGISFNIGTKYLSYVTTTLAINALIVLFLNALNAFISTFKRNDNLDQNTINHITAGTTQLDSLLADMRVVLFPTKTGLASTIETPVVNLNVPKFQTQVTTSATGWGIRLTTIIEWMKIQPGRASAILDVTSESVLRYQEAIKKLKARGDIRNGAATLTVVQSSENVKDSTVAIGKLLFFANTVVGTQQRPAEVKQRLIQMQDLLTAANILDASIIAALQPFIDTPFELLQGADQVVKQLVKVSHDLGFDRAADLLKKADIAGFYSMNVATATYAGAAVAGVSAILASLSAQPDAAQSDVGALEKVRDSFNRQNEAQKVEATRGSTENKNAFVAQEKKNFALDKTLANKAVEVAKTKEPEIAADPANVAENTINKSLGNKLNFGGF